MLAFILFLFQLSLVLSTEATLPIYDRPCWMDYVKTNVGKEFIGEKIPLVVGDPRHIVRYDDNFGTVEPKSKGIEPLGPFIKHEAEMMELTEILFLPPGRIGWYSVLDMFEHGIPSNAIAVAYDNESPPEFICRPRYYDHFSQEIEPLGITLEGKDGDSFCRCRKRVSGGSANHTLYDIALLLDSPAIKGEWPEMIKTCGEL